MIEFNSRIDEKIMQNLTKVYEAVADFAHLPKRIKVNLSFVDEKTIRKLNKDTRNIDKVTDVLTYPYVELRPKEKLKLSDYELEIDPDDNRLLIGDIYICIKRAEEQSKEYGHSLNREMCFLFCHGLLHILGYDHIKKEDEEVMTGLQTEILDKLNIKRENFKCGFVTIIGETNTGKSTLINQLVGEKVAIVSPKSQTTRENIKGVYNDKNSQIVFVDTPGYHKRKTKFDDEMDKQISDATEDTEILLLLLDAKKPLVEQYEKMEKKLSSNAKKILLINKIDEVKYEKTYPQLAQLSKVAKVDEILPISALKGTNCEILIDMIKKYLPTYDFEMRYYPLDIYTDKNLREMSAEIIREKALLCLDDEVPHGIQVVVTDFKEEKDLVEIYADLYCEKESHKPIILGKNGEKIKEISTKSRLTIEWIIEKQVNLNIYVKVKENWRNDARAIAEFGLNAGE